MTASARDEPDEAGAILEVTSTDGRWLLRVAVGGSAMAFLDGTVVNVALPDLGHDLGAGVLSLRVSR